MFFVGNGKKIPAFISYSPKDQTINLVPLRRPSFKFKFLNKIIIVPIFKICLCDGRPFVVIELTNSIGIEFCKHLQTVLHPFSLSIIVSILKHSLMSPLSRLNISLFILSTLLFVGHKITLFFIEMSNGLISFPKISVIKSPLDTKLCGIIKRLLFLSNFVEYCPSPTFKSFFFLNDIFRYSYVLL